MDKIKLESIEFELKNKKDEKKLNQIISQSQAKLELHNNLLRNYKKTNSKEKKRNLLLALKKSSESISLAIDQETYDKIRQPGLKNYYNDLRDELIKFNAQLAIKMKKYKLGFDALFDPATATQSCQNLFEFLFFNADREQISDLYWALDKQANAYKMYTKGYDAYATAIQIDSRIPAECKDYIIKQMDTKEFNIDNWGRDLLQEFNLSEDVYKDIKHFMNNLSVLQQDNLRLKGQITQNLRDDIPHIMNVLGNSEVKFLGGGNAFNFKITNFMTGKPLV